jgi:hypothetical protein
MHPAEVIELQSGYYTLRASMGMVRFRIPNLTQAVTSKPKPFLQAAAAEVDKISTRRPRPMVRPDRARPTPAHSAGAVDVVVTTQGGTGTGSSLYTYVTPVPTVTLIAPTSSLSGLADHMTHRV